VVCLDQALDAEADPQEFAEVGAERTVICVRREPIWRDALAIAMVEQVVRHRLDVSAVARVDDREDEPAPLPEHARNRADRRGQTGDVHERHVAEDAVEAPIRERRQVLRVTVHIGDPALIVGFVSTRVTQHLLRHIDAGHGRAEVGEQPCILALAAREREHFPPRNVAHQFRESGIDETDTFRVKSAAVRVRDLVVCGQRVVGHLSLHIKWRAAPKDPPGSIGMTSALTTKPQPAGAIGIAHSSNPVQSRSGGRVAAVPFHIAIRELTTSGGDRLEPPVGGVVAIVGPNNSGKSALLRELHLALSVHPSQPRPHFKVLADLQVDKGGDAEDLIAWLEEHAYSQDRQGEPHYKRSNVDWAAQSSLLSWWAEGPGFATLTSFLTFLGQADGRLGQVGGSGQYDALNDRPGNPTQVLYANRDLEERLSEISREAFGTGITLNRYGQNLTLLWGEVQEEPPVYPTEDYLDQLRVLPGLGEQGDGVKSFLGTMLVMLTAAYPLMLLDEPEAFLHPPQAQLMGRKLREEVADGTQVFLATHSLDVVEGLLGPGGGNVTIARLTRSGDENRLSVLDPDAVELLWRDPLLRFSNVLEGLFHRGAVVCEGDADCRFYSAVLDEARTGGGLAPHDLLFTHCGGKHRVPTVVQALRAVDVPAAVIVDFDVLREANPFGDIIEALGGDAAAYEPLRQRVAAGLTARLQNPSRAFVKEEIHRVLDGSGVATISRDEADAVRAVLRTEDGWRAAKESGLAAIPRGQEHNDAEALLRDLQTIGLFVVDVGELEGWVPQVGNKGPRWVIEVLEQGLHADPQLAARSFIESVAAVVAEPA
jgi:hypothetical protein